MTDTSINHRIDAGKVAGSIGWLAVVTVISIWLVTLQNEQIPVDVLGDGQYVTAEEVARAVSPHLSQGFFSIDLADIRESIDALPWVASSQVVRRWPGRIQIEITEHRALAQWGAAALLSDELKIYQPETMPRSSLVKLVGPEGSELEVAEVYLDAVGRFKDAAFSVSSVALDPHQGWTLGLTPYAANDLPATVAAIHAEPLMVHMGDSQPFERLELLEKAVLTALGARVMDALRIDLQYDHGFAVQWRSLSGELS